ncbi:MAG: family 43 glycosylhydrolase [Lachnospiraceae bacterium]|nr:family 43 glycosylhydrolase [Lachnospiraceae bacterium]
MNRDYTYNKPWIEQRADPYVIKADNGKYYFTASVPAYDKVILRCADSLSELAKAEEKTVWTKHSSGIMSENIWAPELHYLFGGWYIYFAASDKDDIWALRPYVLKCTGDDPMKDEWTECGQIQCADDDEYSFRAFSLDATVFEYHGDWYYIWAEKVGVGKQISNLYIGRLASATKLATVQVLLTTPDYDWERVDFWVNEGPAVLQRNGMVFVTFSASCTGAPYCMGMLAAKDGSDLLDPRSWEKLRSPVCKTDPALSIFGPGHNSFTIDENGDDICVYHARNYEEIKGDPLYDPNRHAQLMPVTYDEKGWPVFDLTRS